MKTQSSLSNWLLLGGVCLLLLLIGECLARWTPFGDNIGPLWRYHDTLGWTQIPKAKFAMSRDGRDWQVEFNHSGFRDTGHQISKPQGVTRVLVVGDSIGEASQVNLDETYFKILENNLNASSYSEKWEAINISVGDFGSAQELLAFRNYGIAYLPDYVILEIFPLNDLCNNLYEAYGMCKSDNDYYRPYLVQEEDRLAITYRWPLLNKFRKNSSFFALIERITHSLLRGSKNDYRLQALQRREYSNSDPLLFGYFPKAEQSLLAVKAWEITEKILYEFIKEVQSRRLSLIVLIVPFEAAVDEGGWRDYSADKSLAGAERDYSEKRLEGFFSKYGVPVVSPLKEFANSGESSDLYIDGHLSPKAHRIVADLLRQKLLANSQTPPKVD